MAIDRSLFPIGVFDSGVGGLSVLKAIRAELPGENILYVADQIHVPFGPRPLAEVRNFSMAISQYLIDRGAKIVVVACNTASAAALRPLRENFPNTPFIGMEPAVKPAAETTRTGVVGILATPATFQGELYASVVERFANGVQIFQDTCPGLVGQIEKGYLSTVKTRNILLNALEPMLENGVDTIVLGCTHYPFVIPLIHQIVGPGVRVIDPAPAIARQVFRVLQQNSLLITAPADQYEKFFTTGDPEPFDSLSAKLIGGSTPAVKINWIDNRLILPIT